MSTTMFRIGPPLPNDQRTTRYVAFARCPQCGSRGMWFVVSKRVLTCTGDCDAVIPVDRYDNWEKLYAAEQKRRNKT